MLRIAVIALLASTTMASSQDFYGRRQSTTVFGPNAGQITTIQPTPGGFFASDNRGNTAMGTGRMVTTTPRVPMLPTLTPPTTSNFD